MESLIRSAKSAVTAKEAVKGVATDRISIKNIITDTIGDCKKIPLPIRTIVKDRLFYRCANSIID